MKKMDTGTIVIIPVIVTALTIYFRTNFLVSTLLFFALPSAYIIFRNAGIFKKSSVFALLFGTIFYVVLDPLAALNGAWAITGTLFPIKFLGLATIENYIFALLWTLLVILFYEHFFDRGRRYDKISPTIRYLIYPSGLLVLGIITAFYGAQSLLYIPYFYLFAGILFSIIPLCLFLYEFPIFLPRFVVIGFYFSFLLFLFEIVALENNQWAFPGADFVGVINFFGYKFPVEEFFIWIVAATPGLLSFYEFFADNRRI